MSVWNHLGSGPHLIILLLVLSYSLCLLLCKVKRQKWNVGYFKLYMTFSLVPLPSFFFLFFSPAPPSPLQHTQTVTYKCLEQCLVNMHWKGFLSFNSNLLHSNLVPCPMPGARRSDKQDRLDSCSFGVCILLEKANCIWVIRYDCDNYCKVQDARRDCLEEKGRTFRDVELWRNLRQAAVPGALQQRSPETEDVALGYVLFGGVG